MPNTQVRAVLSADRDQIRPTRLMSQSGIRIAFPFLLC
jgi:hypothetical protein